LEAIVAIASPSPVRRFVILESVWYVGTKWHVLACFHPVFCPPFPLRPKPAAHLDGRSDDLLSRWGVRLPAVILTFGQTPAKSGATPLPKPGFPAQVQVPPRFRTLCEPLVRGNNVATFWYHLPVFRPGNEKAPVPPRPLIPSIDSCVIGVTDPKIIASEPASPQSKGPPVAGRSLLSADHRAEASASRSFW
jgi:hypothetical protein